MAEHPIPKITRPAQGGFHLCRRFRAAFRGCDCGQDNLAQFLSLYSVSYTHLDVYKRQCVFSL